MARAHSQGELTLDLNIDTALDLLYSPLYARLFVGLGALTEAGIADYLQLVFRAVFVPGTVGFEGDSGTPPSAP